MCCVGCVGPAVLCIWTTSSRSENLSRQCDHCRRPDCLVSAADLTAVETETQSLLVDQPFATSEMGDSMDSDLLLELSGETWVASALMEELTWDIPTVGADIDLVTATREDQMLQTVRSWVESGKAPPWPDCAGLSPELRCWRLQIGNLKLDSVGRLWRRRSPPAGGSQLVVPVRERQELIRQFHDSLFAGHLGITHTIFRLLDRVYWPGLRRDVKTYITSCTICLARKSPCPRRASNGTCGSRSSMGTSGYGLIRHVGYHNTGKQICSRYGGLFLQVDGGLPIAR